MIGQYRLGFELAPNGRATNARIFIDYDMPAKGIERWLGPMFGDKYARWCTERMANDAAKLFRVR